MLLHFLFRRLEARRLEARNTRLEGSRLEGSRLEGSTYRILGQIWSKSCQHELGRKERFHFLASLMTPERGGLHFRTVLCEEIPYDLIECLGLFSGITKPKNVC